MPCLRPLVSFLSWFFFTIIFCSWASLQFGGEPDRGELWFALVMGTVFSSWLCLVFALCIAMEVAD
nr:hypothetical protein MarFTME_368 [Marseillevirus futianmevirus]